MSDAAATEPRRRRATMQADDAGHTQPPSETAVMQTPNDPAPSPAQPEATAPPSGWYDMADAPDTGRAITLTDGVNVTEAVWHNTRYFDAKGGARWKIRSYWAIRNSGGARVPWTPTAWRPADDMGAAA